MDAHNYRKIDRGRFWYAHQLFLNHMREKSGGVNFVGFDHPFLFIDEVSYKSAVYNDAHQVLECDRWPRLVARRGQIVDRLKQACSPKITRNLLHQKYGPQNSSAKSLYRAKAQVEADYETHLYRLFDSAHSEQFGEAFDNLAAFLRQEGLGCNWAYMSYISFLAHPQLCFPVRPTRFDRVLEFYGVPQRVAGKVSWERYQVLFSVANEAKYLLLMYGDANAIEIQSYLWVISYLLDGVSPEIEMFDQTFEIEVVLDAREKAAIRRERIGVLGELHILELEKNQLIDAGRPDLATQIRLQSVADPSCGYDILSFDENGQPKHIEVKSTDWSQESDQGFWLTDNERNLGERDPHWTAYRVWNTTTAPHYQDLGNIVTDQRWSGQPSSWYFSRKE